MSQNLVITEYGVRHFLPRLAKTFEDGPSQCRGPSKVSQTVLLRTQDNHKLDLCLREHIGCCGTTKDIPFWRLELSFHQWIIDEDDEETRDDDFCDAFRAYIGGCVDEDTLYMSSFTSDLKPMTGDIDPIPKITRILQRAIAAEMCGCGKQIVPVGEDICFNCMLGLEAPDKLIDEPVDMSCPICLKIMSKHSPITSCCKKMSHVRCLKNCNGRCPFCRTEPFEYA